jgi:hypothetical protein
VVLLEPAGQEALPLLTKDEVAERIIDWVQARMGAVGP